MDQKSAISTVEKYIFFLKKNKFNIKHAYIFGSFARGNFNENSDIDLAIVLDNLINSFTMQIQLMKLSRKFDSRIEPHPFDTTDFNLSNPFAKEILNHGIRVV